MNIRRLLFSKFIFVSLLTSIYVVGASANRNGSVGPDFQALVDHVSGTTHQYFKSQGLGQNDFAVTVIIDPKTRPIQADYRGSAAIYPASVVKLFYMSYYFRLLQDRKIKPTPELKRGLRDMVVDSGNEATGYVVDALTGTTSGPELSVKEFEAWSYKRNAVNRYFRSLGYRNINVNQKTHCEDAYGVEQQFRKYRGENRNMLTTNATARLLADIVSGKSVTGNRSSEMMNLLRRDLSATDGDGFRGAFMADALPDGSKVWAKAGWTSKTRHDAAYIETPEGLKLIVVIFTEGQAQNKEIIPFLARELIQGIKGLRKL